MSKKSAADDKFLTFSLLKKRENSIVSSQSKNTSSYDKSVDNKASLQIIKEESENVCISFCQYMQRFSTVFQSESLIVDTTDAVSSSNPSNHDNSSKIFSAGNSSSEEEGKQQQNVKYDTGVLLNVLKTEKALGDHIASVDIYNAQSGIQNELNIVKINQAKATLEKGLSRAIVICSLCFSTMFFALNRKRIATGPTATIIVLMGGAGIVVDHLSSQTLDRLNNRSQALNNLSTQLNELQDRSSIFRSIIRDLIIDIQNIKLMESEGTDEVNHKLFHIQNEALKNEQFIKRILLKENLSALT